MSASTYSERYAAATASSNLRQLTDRPCRADLLLAMAMADPRLGSELHRARAANDAHEIRRLHGLLADEVVRIAERRRWTIRREVEVEAGLIMPCYVLMPRPLPRRIARAALHHWLFGQCPACTGRKFRLLSEVLAERGEPAAAPADRDTLADEPCPACAGTGRTTIEAGELADYVRHVVALLEDRYAAAARQAERRLA